MPTYTLKCTACDHGPVEFWGVWSSVEAEPCPSCGKTTLRPCEFGANPVVFGHGWFKSMGNEPPKRAEMHVTDNATGKTKIHKLT